MARLPLLKILSNASIKKLKHETLIDVTELKVEEQLLEGKKEILE